MFTSRIARMFGLTLVAFWLSAGLLTFAADEKPKEKAKDEKKDETKKVVSKLKVIVPDEEAELLIEGKKTETPKPLTVNREFDTPPIEAGKKWEYEFSVTWHPNNYTTLTRTKTVEFKGGEDVVVDLTKADPKNPDQAKIRWVPTPDDVVDEMIKLGGVKAGDIVYEPGPGDGRVLIAAVKKGAKKAVGIEIDPKKAAEAKEAVKKAKLEQKITIIEGDALKDRDYSEATVVMLYMGNEFNNLLRPILEKQLKPGTRIVSHRFVMGDWMPDKTITVTGNDGEEYILHLWTVKDKKKK